jgi:hypothetical protein
MPVARVTPTSIGLRRAARYQMPAPDAMQRRRDLQMALLRESTALGKLVERTVANGHSLGRAEIVQGMRDHLTILRGHLQQASRMGRGSRSRGRWDEGLMRPVTARFLYSAYARELRAMMASETPGIEG